MDRIRRNRSTQVGIRYDGISQDKTRQDRVRIFVGYDQIRQVDRQVGRFIDSFVCTYMYANGRVKYVCTCNIHMYMIVHACLPYYTVQYRSLPYHSTLYHIIAYHTLLLYCTIRYHIITKFTLHMLHAFKRRTKALGVQSTWRPPAGFFNVMSQIGCEFRYKCLSRS